MHIHSLVRIVANLPVIRKLKPLVHFRPDFRLALLKCMPEGAHCAEIGVWKGEFSARIIAVTKPKMLHLVDPWMFRPQYPDRFYGGTAARGQKDMDDIFSEIKKKFGECENIRIHRATSREFLEEFTEHLDWIYIDGDHSTEVVLEDLNLSSKMVKKSGIIAGDDYYWKDSDGSLPVKIAVDKFCSEHGYNKKLIVGQFILTLN